VAQNIDAVSSRVYYCCIAWAQQTIWQSMNLNWDHLRFFLALAETGSLTAAAQALNVSHTTVLRRVRAIEKALETHLFDHTSQGHTLTPAGVSLHLEVRKIKVAVDAVARQISGVDQTISGPVVITTTDTLGYFFLPPIIRQLQEQYPELEITLQVSNQLSDLSNREADIALRAGVSPPPHLVGRRVGTIGFAACASPDYIEQHRLERFPADLAAHQFIMLDKSLHKLPVYTWLAQQCQVSRSIVTASGFLTAWRLCVAGCGITVLPDYLVNADSGLQRLDTEITFASNELWLLSHVDMRDALRIRLVKRVLYAELKRSFG